MIAKEAEDLEAAVKDEGYRGYHKPPQKLTHWPDAKKVKMKTRKLGGGGLRKRWKDKKGRIYEWDSQHGAIEKYDKRGNHLGEFDPETGKQLKPANKTRSVEP